MTDVGSLTVQCVYGADDVAHLTSSLIPSLAAATALRVQLHTINYDPSSPIRLESGEYHNVVVRDIQNLSDHPSGFAENHNQLFREFKPCPYFVIINPDCIATPGCFDTLIARKMNSAGGVAIVESRQWPFEHPKEYDEATLETPWASGACSLIDSEFFTKVGGFAQEYFLYTEDVDLSWRAWIAGYRVLYEPDSVVIHFSDGPHRKPGEVTPEVLFSISNDIALTYKFFGDAAAEKAIQTYRTREASELVEVAAQRYRTEVKPLISFEAPAMLPSQIKVIEPGRYHEFR